ncbi:MAG: hypothetical protein IJV33_09070 [Bacteroidaceae bacterium]|nr:hypothetical protein [Bacteroidaceae bacterium]
MIFFVSLKKEEDGHRFSPILLKRWLCFVMFERNVKIKQYLCRKIAIMRNQNKKNVDSILNSFIMEGQNIISQIFSDEEIQSLGITFSQIYKDPSLSELEITLNEKCILVLSDIKIEKDYDSLAEAIKATKNFDFDGLYLQLSNPKSKRSFEDVAIDVVRWELFYNEGYYNAFCEAENLTDNEKQELAAYKENIIKSSVEAEDLPGFLLTKDRIKNFFIFHIAATIDRMKKESASDGVNSDQNLQMIRVAKVFVNAVKEKYELWESSSADIISQEQFMCSLDVFNTNEELTEKQLLLALFVLYYTTYSNNWKKMCFEHELSKHCDTPIHTLHFIQELKKHKYCRDFCREYENYIENSGIKPLFNTTIINPTTPNLCNDTDLAHKDWFRKVDKSKVKGIDKDEALYKAVRELFYKLKESGSIPEATSEPLFIYRFTGFLAPLPIDIKIEWKGENLNTLAYIFKCLYTRKEGETDIAKPQYSKLSNFFIPSLSNGSALAESLDMRKKPKVVALLQDCGFVNVDPSKIK